MLKELDCLVVDKTIFSLSIGLQAIFLPFLSLRTFLYIWVSSKVMHGSGVLTRLDWFCESWG